MLRLDSKGRSHVGLVRDHNEDAAFAGPYIALVADGVGGAAAGEVASATTAYVVSAMSMAHADDPLDSVLRAALKLAQANLVAGTQLDPARTGMATTLTAIAGNGRAFVLAHLGDSRAYLYRDGILSQLTRDHTWVQSMIDEGRLPVEKAREHPWRHVVTRYLGADLPQEPDILELDLLVGDRLLLCSDGLTDLVDDSTIADLLAAQPDDDLASGDLVRAALDRGGRDNVTVLVSTVVDSERISADGALIGALGDIHNIVDAAAVRVAHPA